MARQEISLQCIMVQVGTAQLFVNLCHTKTKLQKLILLKSRAALLSQWASAIRFLTEGNLNKKTSFFCNNISYII